MTFVGSLFTHLPTEATLDVLATLVRSMRPGGLLIFSTQGESCLEHLGWYGERFARREDFFRSQVTRSGHAFVPYARQAGYGITIHAPRFLRHTMHALYGSCLHLVDFTDRGWDDHQEVWVYRRGPKANEGS